MVMKYVEITKSIILLHVDRLCADCSADCGRLALLGIVRTGGKLMLSAMLLFVVLLTRL